MRWPVPAKHQPQLGANIFVTTRAAGVRRVWLIDEPAVHSPHVVNGVDGYSVVPLSEYVAVEWRGLDSLRTRWVPTDEL